MIGPQHYADAQLMIAAAVTHFAAGDRAEGEFVIKVAQVHATLALAAATATARGNADPYDWAAWREVAS